MTFYYQVIVLMYHNYALYLSFLLIIQYAETFIRYIVTYDDIYMYEHFYKSDTSALKCHLNLMIVKFSGFTYWKFLMKMKVLDIQRHSPIRN